MVEGDDSSEYSPTRDGEERQPQRVTPPRRGTRGTRSPDPEFVMPTMDASWAESSSRSTRPHKEGRLLERENRRSNGSPEKRIRTRASTDKYASASTRNLRKEPSQIEEIVGAVVDKGGNILGHVLDIFGGAFRILKTPLSYLLAIYLLFGLGIVLRTLVTNSIYASLSPICRIPGVSLLNLPFCSVYRVDSSHGSPPPVEFDELMSVQAKFEEVLEESTSNTALPMDMKRGEASIRDLRQLVRYSQLHSKYVTLTYFCLLPSPHLTERDSSLVLDGIFVWPSGTYYLLIGACFGVVTD